MNLSVCSPNRCVYTNGVLTVREQGRGAGSQSSVEMFMRISAAHARAKRLDQFSVFSGCSLAVAPCKFRWVGSLSMLTLRTGPAKKFSAKDLVYCGMFIELDTCWNNALGAHANKTCLAFM